MPTPIKNHRHCYLIYGHPHDFISAFLDLCNDFPSLLICTQDTKTYDGLNIHQKTKVINFKQAKNELGKTHYGILLDLTHGVSASALAILTGTIMGQGVCVIALPKENWLSLNDLDMARHLPWPLTPSAVTSYFKRYFLQQVLAADSPFKTWPSAEIKLPSPPQLNSVALMDLTLEQQTVQKTIETECSSTQVLIAARGRGKSTLLGDTVANWMKQGKRVVVTAPNADALAMLKSRYDQCMSASITSQTNKELPFIAPDALLQIDEHWDHLVVDEAAMIPVPMLMALIAKADHCLFSTTDFGYEGAGKGFGLRFCAHLEEKHRLGQGKPLTRLTLNQPVRWQENDPLETWVNQLFFLCPPANEQPQTLERQTQTYQYLQGEDWLNNLALLEQSFNLLVNAHYQTSPDNLRWVMDDPSITTWLSLTASFTTAPLPTIPLLINKSKTDSQALSKNGMERCSLYCVAILTSEGDLPRELSQAVLEGRRRPRGHLIPQSLLAHEGQSNAGDFLYWRISRIASQENNRGMGYASQLLDRIEQAAKEKSIDFLSASFAATTDTIKFWQKNGFICVRLGTSKDQASGCYSVMVVKALNPNALEAAQQWHLDYLSNLVLNLPRDYTDIPPSLAERLQESKNGFEETFISNRLSKKDKQDLLLFVEHHRPYLTIRGQLTRLIQQAIVQQKLDTDSENYLLLHTLISQSPQTMDFSYFQLYSKNAVQNHLKKIIHNLLQKIN